MIFAEEGRGGTDWSEYTILTKEAVTSSMVPQARMTLLEVDGEGYISTYSCGGGTQARLIMTVDGVTTMDLVTGGFLVPQPDNVFYSSFLSLRHGNSNGGSNIPSRREYPYLMPLPYTPGSITGAQHGVIIATQPIFFKHSIKMEIENTASSSALSFGYYYRGGIKT